MYIYIYWRRFSTRGKREKIQVVARMSAHTERGIVTKYVCCPRRTRRDRLRSKIARGEAVVVERRSTSRGQIINGENWTRRISWPPTDTAWHVNAAVSVGERLPVVFIRPGLDDVAPSLSRTRPHLRHASVHPPSPSVQLAYIYIYTYSFHEHLRCVRS